MYEFVCEVVDGILRYHVWHSEDGFGPGPNVNDVQRVELTVWDAGVQLREKGLVIHLPCLQTN